MKIHYKGRSWKEVIDPTFNIIIRKFLETMELVNIPSNQGHLILDLPADSLKRIENAGYPKFGKFYEKENKDGLFEISKLLFPDALKNTDLESLTKAAKKTGVSYKDYVRVLRYLAVFIKRQNGCDYYLNSFKPLESEDSYKKHISKMTENQRKTYSRKINSDIHSMIWHVGMTELDELKKENEYTEKLRVDFLNDSKLIRRMLFGIWNNIALMNHKKSLRQLFIEARDDENDKSLFHLFQYDPTLFDNDWVQVRIRKALYSGDMKFFDKLGKTLLKGCLDTRKNNLDISLVLTTFWKAGLYRLNTEQKKQLFKDSDIKFKQNETALRQIVNRIRPFVDWPTIKN